jgi:transcription antitermination factor NusG
VSSITQWEKEGGAVSEINEIQGSPAETAPKVSTGRWYAVHTRAKHERRIARELELKGIRTFLPAVHEVHHWSDRRKVLEVPLFSCYVFVNVDGWRGVHLQVLRTPGLLRWVGFDGEPAAIPETQIEAVRSTLANGLRVSSHPFLKIGQRVRVRGGCLDGVEGVLLGENSKDCRLVVSIELIQQSIAVSLHGYDIEPV